MLLQGPCGENLSSVPYRKTLCKFRIAPRSLYSRTLRARDQPGGPRHDPSHALSGMGQGQEVLLKSRYLRRSFMLTGRKLALTLAFAGLVVVAFGISCGGFFTDNTLSSIAIQPPSPQVEVGSSTTVTLQAWGTYSDNSRSRITSGVSWTSSPNTIVEILAPCATQECGDATVQGVASGTSTITASAQGISATATATAYLGNITNFEVCQGTTVPVTSCTSTWSVNALNGSTTQPFVAQGTSNGTTVDLTTAATWTVAPTASTGSITCTNNGASPEECLVDQNTTAGPYTITVTYGANPTQTATVNVTVTN